MYSIEMAKIVLCIEGEHHRVSSVFRKRLFSTAVISLIEYHVTLKVHILVIY
jgi:hypothetical protein